MNLKASRYGYLALLLALGEILIIWGGTAIAFALPGHDWHWLRKVMIETYSLGLVASVGFASAGLAKDTGRIPSICAIIFAIGNILVCSIPIAY